MNKITIVLEANKAMLLWGMLHEQDLTPFNLKAYRDARNDFTTQLENQITEEQLEECRHEIKVFRLIGTMPNKLRNGQTPK